MKHQSLLNLIILIASSITSVDSSAAGSEFQQWAAKYNRHYETKVEELKAAIEWNKNKVIIDAINKDSNQKWIAEIGKYADLSPQQFAQQMLLRPQQTDKSYRKQNYSKMIKVGEKSEVPTSFDWRSDGSRKTVTSVKDQGTVGSCWAFSTIGNIEGQWALSGKDLVDLSPEFLVDCDGTHDENHSDCGVFGGWPYLAYDFVINANGVPSETSYPYCSGTGDCYPCMQGPISLCGPPSPNCNKNITANCPNMIPTAKINAWSDVSTDEDQIAATLFAQGPLSVLLDASQLQYYKSGVWDGHIDSLSPALGCHSESLNHAVLLVGYGVDNSTGVDQKYWVVKNSWGENWGEDGYFRITRGTGACGINTAVTTAIVL